MANIEPYARSGPDIYQVEFRVPPTVVRAGSEDFVLVANGSLASSAPLIPVMVSSFLGVQPGDQVEVAIDVVTNENQILHNRSLHKETWGIYEAWEHVVPLQLNSTHYFVTITCRVNGDNRDGLPQALFEGLVRLSFK